MARSVQDLVRISDIIIGAGVPWRRRLAGNYLYCRFLTTVSYDIHSYKSRHSFGSRLLSSVVIDFCESVHLLYMVCVLFKIYRFDKLRGCKCIFIVVFNNSYHCPTVAALSVGIHTFTRIIYVSIFFK